MLKRVYVNNFRCMVNFEQTFSGINLLMGPNGAGKSTLFDVLYRVRQFIADGEKASDIYPLSDFTNWFVTGPGERIIELDVEGNGGRYRYRLKLWHHTDHPGEVFVREETLKHNDQPLFEFIDGKAQIHYGDDRENQKFPMDYSRSGLGVLQLQEHQSYNKLIWFRNWLKGLRVLRINPALMGAESRHEVRSPDLQLTNYASWFRHLSQERQGQVFDLTVALRDILPGFDSFSLREAGEAKMLWVGFKDPNGRVRHLKLNQLSEGQRALIALYTLLHCSPEEEPSTLCVDEPENFLALPEVQLWLNLVQERSDNGQGQAILISHHPRIINFLARGDSGIWLERDGTGPTRTKRISLDCEGGGLTAAELVERGWIQTQ